MSFSPAFWFRVGCVSAALGVTLGAFGAHGLKNRVKDVGLLKTWETAAHYQFIHSFGLIFLSMAPSSHSSNSLVNLTGALFSTGIVLFSGSLYLLVLTENKKLGIITPFGGLAFIAAWLAMAYKGLK
eukprot:TRINITY_DN3697_c0_g1_i1.p1 TRINITY_DN3697_c0_g1~~TRINITY_DN3697_c0_g1_i1.p1  ORF type:complete len:143 (+),score=26.35 TRINITY_DN3697_c0_g1_i1:50-430(+)